MIKAKNHNKLLGSGIILAFISSLCCITPILALIGTVGSAVSIFSWIEPLRPYLLAATALVLCIAFYNVYKPAAKDDCGCAGKKPRMQSKTFLWIITILSIGLSTFPYYMPFFQKAVPKPIVVATSNVQQTVIQIQGMSCAACEGHVTHALQEKNGVKQVATSYAKGESIVRFDSTQISLRQSKEVIESKTGYKITNIQTDVN